jgi:ferredoxin
MPWVEESDCIGCELCIENCPTDAICIIENKAVIEMEDCIHCGICHGICPQGAVRHDSEKIPEKVENNINRVRELLKYYDTDEDRQKFMKRIRNHFNNNRIVMEKTLDRINDLSGGIKNKTDRIS